jgi:ATP-dependent Lon protease
MKMTPSLYFIKKKLSLKSSMGQEKKMPKSCKLPLIPLRDLVSFPDVVFTLFIGRESSIAAVREAVAQDETLFLVAQIDADQEDPETSDLYDVGVVGRVLQVLNLGDGTMKVLVEGLYRAKMDEVDRDKGVSVYASVSKLETDHDVPNESVMLRALMRQIDRYAKIHKEFSAEIVRTLHAYKDLQRCIFVFAGHMLLAHDIKQALLATKSLTKQADILLEFILREIEWSKKEKQVQDRVKDRINKEQRDYYLRLKLDELKKELGEDEVDGPEDDFDFYASKIETLNLPQEDYDKLMQEVAKLKKMPVMSAEATVLRNYFDWVVGLPWDKKADLNQSIVQAEKVLEKDHYGLDELKERVLEHIAVMLRVGKIKGSILCLVGPPGVGKTSFARSVARATGRPFERIALGGVRDEAEIRGHRKTYIGAMPGRIIKAMKSAGASNPLILLDEIDKMGMDYRGDPAAALLEVLDAEQNHSFNDHYLELDYDLSDVLFITTANTMDIPEALVDRMEIVQLSGYTEQEKGFIAKRYLLPRQKEMAGLEPKDLMVRDAAITRVIQHYTREAGVRTLERQLAKVCRKQVYAYMKKKKVRKVVDQQHLEDYLGVQEYEHDSAYQHASIGLVRGLAWTSVGGELLTIEASVLQGTGKVTLTGQLGDVMKESIEAALTVVKTQVFALGYESNYFETHDVHVHVPEGATPKDGPSAGVAMSVAILSSITENPVVASLAMTGEVTLRGEILAIGGLKEKLLAAVRGKVKTVFIPKVNAKDLVKLPKEVADHLKIVQVKRIEQVFEQAFTQPLTRVDSSKQKKQRAVAKKSSKRTNKSSASVYVEAVEAES